MPLFRVSLPSCDKAWFPDSLRNSEARKAVTFTNASNTPRHERQIWNFSNPRRRFKQFCKVIKRCAVEPTQESGGRADSFLELVNIFGWRPHPVVDLVEPRLHLFVELKIEEGHKARVRSGHAVRVGVAGRN